MTPELQKIVQESTRVPGMTWRFHPAVPARLIFRDPDLEHPTQRSSNKVGLGVKITKGPGGKYNSNGAAGVHLSPNASRFYALDGATRAEITRDELGDKVTLPCFVWPTEMTRDERAFWFRLLNTRSNVSAKIEHATGVTAGLPVDLAVRDAAEKLGGSASPKALTKIFHRFGPTVLMQVAETAHAMWKMEARRAPSWVLAGIALVLVADEKPIKEWFYNPRYTVDRLIIRSERRRLDHGSKGPLANHASCVLTASTGRGLEIRKKAPPRDTTRPGKSAA